MRAFAGELLFLAMVGCGDGLQPCGECNPDEICFRDSTCRKTCKDPSECPTGLTCQAYDGDVSVCQCDLGLCGEKEDCVDPLSPCRSVVCSDRIPCEDATQICDAPANRCLPANGDCSANGACPTLSEPAANGVTIECDADTSLCRAQLTPITPALSAKNVRIVRPNTGELIKPPALPEFEWRSDGAAALIQVFTGVPLTPDDVSRLAVWGASVPAGGAARISWAGGKPVSNGHWLEQTPSPPADGIYFLSVQTVDNDTLLGTSDLIPFGVGKSPPWRVPGNRCHVEGFPGDCVSPALPQACVDSTCRQVCGSDLDCAPRSCLPPKEGVRFCGL